MRSSCRRHRLGSHHEIESRAREVATDCHPKTPPRLCARPGRGQNNRNRDRRTGVSAQAHRGRWPRQLRQRRGKRAPLLLSLPQSPRACHSRLTPPDRRSAFTAAASSPLMSALLGIPAFRPLTGKDLPMLHAWLQRPHVAEWWHEPTTLAELERDYLPCAMDESSTRAYIPSLPASPSVSYSRTSLWAQARAGGSRKPIPEPGESISSWPTPNNSVAALEVPWSGPSWSSCSRIRRLRRCRRTRRRRMNEPSEATGAPVLSCTRRSPHLTAQRCSCFGIERAILWHRNERCNPEAGRDVLLEESRSSRTR